MDNSSVTTVANEFGAMKCQCDELARHLSLSSSVSTKGPGLDTPPTMSLRQTSCVPIDLHLDQCSGTRLAIDNAKEREMAMILVTDDDRECRDSIQRTLEKDGHVVEGAGNVDEALRVIHNGQFDLIVCDYRMPGRTGMDLLLELKHQGSHIPFLMVSACADTDTQTAATKLGAVGMLRKPFRRQDLIDTVNLAIQGAQQ